LTVAFAPALSPAALAYSAKASGLDASARLIVPDWDRLDGSVDPFDGTLIPRRAMESPQEWRDAGDIFAGVYGFGCWAGFWGCGGALAAGVAIYGAGRAIEIASQYVRPQNPNCTIYTTGPDCF
jgi:hypothetical protein